MQAAARGGANVNQDEKNGCTPLFIASQNGHKKVCELLLDSGADPDLALWMWLWTPLIMASQNGNYEICKLLLDKDATVDRDSVDGRTPLYFAVQNGHKKVCELLLAGCQHPPGRSGWSQLSVHCKSGGLQKCLRAFD